MTPLEKAKQLISINSLAILIEIGHKLTIKEVMNIAKQSSIILINEILEISKQTEYYEEVIEEIKKL